MIILFFVGMLLFGMGLLLGAGGMAAIGVLSAGGVEAGVEREQFLSLLIEKHEIEPRVAISIANEGLDKWAQWRAKSRPILWRFGWEWPEYLETFKQEFQEYYERSLPESSESEGELDVESNAEYLEDYSEASLPTETPSEATSDSGLIT